MKILIVHRLIGSFGGAHKYLLELVKVLRALNWEVNLLINSDPDLSGLLDLLKAEKVHINFKDFDNLNAQAAGNAFSEILGNIAPDIIDFETAAKSIRKAALNSKAFALSNAKKVFTMHLPIATDQSSLYSWKSKIPLTYSWKSRKERANFIQLFDQGLSVSSHHAKLISKLLDITEGFFTIIPNGIDTEQFHPVVTPTNNRRVRIVACGGLTAQKRYDLLIEAAHLLKSKTLDFEILIAGEGEDRKQLEQQIDMNQLRNHVRLLGHISTTNKFLREGDIFVMCSDSEGFPYAAIEAMSTALPSVITRAGDLPQMIRDGVDGIVINCGDAQALSNAIFELVNETDKRFRMGDSARQRAVEKFDLKITSKQTRTFYLDCGTT